MDILSSVASTAPGAWDALLSGRDPFNQHSFLRTLEATGAVGPERGWLPRHLVLRDPNGQLQAALPLYLKRHSYGEYIFDWNLAAAADAAGVPFYPKLVAMVPWAPVTNGRFLGASAAIEPLSDGALSQMTHDEAQSVQLLYLREAEAMRLDPKRWIHRRGLQFQWFNRGYASFEAHLEAMRSAARKGVRKERRRAAELPLTYETRLGGELSASDCEAIAACYAKTCDKKFGMAYLPPGFFEALRTELATQTVVNLARATDGRVIAMALAFVGDGVLYGRHWGALEEHADLHFELCYHRFIAWAIEHGLQRFESGAQGLHKLKRGFEPVLVRAAYAFAHPGLHASAARYFAGEAAALEAECAALAEHTPYRSSG